ncbi:MAG TPA: aminotransferase class V-fold PLP-dependent enzyme, partial [Acidimicrobiales bacterium]|nr:aminotransferase class V-fold PLP-dependent enzyme [Acidimicrobiales bacterium]
MNLDVATVKKDFPLLSGNPDLVYLDSASSAQKPAAVLDAMTDYYETTHANVHRGVYGLAQEATERFEGGRAKVARFLGATDPNEVVFTKNVTEALNLLAHSWGRSRLSSGDVVLLSEMEHHANLVPWLMLAQERGVELRYIPVDQEGELDLSDLDRLLDGARLVSIAGMSNVLGTINPVTRIAEAAHAVGALVAVDAAQLVPHVAVDVSTLGCDFLGFTGHKMCGPTGIGGFWARAELLEEMPPFMGGGEMIRDVRLDGFTPNVPPWKFEAGTPPIAEAIGLGAAVDYLESLGMEAVREHEKELTAYALRS